LDPLVALEQLRFKSSATLAESAMAEDQREKLVATTSPQLMYDTWRTSSSREIKQNCAITLAHMFLLRDVPSGEGEAGDELLLPVLSLCCSVDEEDRAAILQAACVQALLRRCGVGCPVLQCHSVAGLVHGLRTDRRR
jgi:hypothetical protein